MAKGSKDSGKGSAKDESPAELEKTLVKYLVAQNRPFNMHDIHCNLKLKTSKANVTKILTQMVESKVIHGKQYGKQWIYAPIQVHSEPTSEESTENVEENMDTRIETLSAEKETLSTDVSAMSSKLSGLLETPTNAELDIALKTLNEENRTLSEKLEKLRSQTEESPLLSPEELAAVDQHYFSMRKKWSERKKMFTNIMSELKEAIPGSIQDFYEKMGIETDEYVGVSIHIDPFAMD